MPVELNPLLIAAAVVGGYLLGSIPFGVIATRLGGAGDVPTVGTRASQCPDTIRIAFGRAGSDASTPER